MNKTICEKCGNQKIVGDNVITFKCVHQIQKDMKILYRNSRANYISHEEKLKVKEIIRYYSLDNTWEE
jgi:hypothetical protein